MKKILITFAMLLAMVSCGNKSQNNENVSASVETITIDKNTTAIIYFHSNHRCATCLSVEEAAKKAIADDKTIPFYSVDITLDSSKALMKQYNIGAQTLLVVKGEQRKDVTSSAFMYARSKPEKVIDEIQNVIANL